MRRELPLSALHRALQARRPAAGLVHHGHRGSQYASREYWNTLLAHPVACSLSRAGDCYENVVAESFSASLKEECLSRVHPATRTEAHDAIKTYIDGCYNPVRSHSGLGYVSPLNYEAAHRRGQNAA
jgi:putative transposase